MRLNSMPFPSGAFVGNLVTTQITLAVRSATLAHEERWFIMAVVLIVENNEYQRELYQQELSDAGYVVWLTEDGWKAIDMVRNQRPDIVVLDLHMPGMDGLDALSRLLDVDPKLPVIIYTAYSSYKDSFLSWGADEYLVKSSDITSLTTAIQRVLTRRAQLSAAMV